MTSSVIFLLEGLADALEGRQAAAPHQLLEALLEGLQAPRRVCVGKGLEGRLALELEEHGDLFEDADDVFIRN